MRGRRGHRPGRALTAAAAGAALVLLAGCGGNAAPPEVGPGGDRSAHAVQLGSGTRAVVTGAAAEAALVAASWDLAWAMLAAGDEPAGTVVSPAGLVLGLAMLGETATGEGGAALDAVLGAAGQDRTDAANALLASVERFAGDPAAVREKDPPTPPVVHVATQVTVDDEWTLDEGFLDRLMAGYGTGALVADLGSQQGIGVLDDWARYHSGGLVERSGITPDPELVAVLATAVTLAAAWVTPFEEGATTQDPFTLGDGGVDTVATMHGASIWGYAAGDGWQAVRLPYQGTDGDAGLHADVLLPPLGTDPATADPQVVAGLLAALDAADQREVALALPTVELRSSVDLRPALAAAGLEALLDGARAGLDGMVVQLVDGTISLQQAVQEAVLLVDEKGTRAAATTMLGAGGAGPPLEPVEMVVDHPYLLVVSDGATGWPLFVAAISDPRG